MVGLISGDPIDSAAEQAEGSSNVPASYGSGLLSAATSGFQGSIGPRVYRFAQDELAAPSPTLTPDEANQKYGIPGALTFKDAVPETMASDLYQAKHSDILRQDNLSRSTVGGVASTLAGFAGGIADPTNLAASFIPGVGEANAARMLGTGIAENVAGRLAVRAIAGASQGAVGQAALEPLNYALDQHEQQDWTMGQALRDMAFGTVLGGGLHTTFSTISDLRGKPLPEWTSPASRATEAQVEAATPQARQDAVQAGVAQVMEDRPVDVAPVFDANEAANDLTPPPAAFNGRAVPKPQSLLQFLADKGGVTDPGGDLAAMDAGKVFLPGRGRFVRRNGLSLDYAREAAEEAGFLRPDSDTSDLLNAIDSEIRGNKQYRTGDAVEYAQNQFDAGERDYRDPDQGRYDDYQAEVADHADEAGLTLSQAETDQASRAMLNGASVHEAVFDAVRSGDLDRAYAHMADNAAYEDPEVMAARQAGQDAVARQVPPDAEMQRAQQQIADHEQFFDRARTAGALEPEHEAEIQAANDAQQKSGGIMSALKQAAACLMRVGG